MEITTKTYLSDLDSPHTRTLTETRTPSFGKDPPIKTVTETELPPSGGMLGSLIAHPPQSSQPAPSPGEPPSTMPNQPAQPAEPPQPGNTAPPRSKAPPPYIFDAVVDNEVYHLPSPNEPPLEILLLDGSISKLFSDKVIIRGQTLSIPSELSSVQEISGGGQTIKAQPGESTEPEGEGDDKGGGGGGGLFGAIGSLVGAASDAVGGIADVGTGTLGFAAGTGGAAAGGLAGTLAASAKNVGGFTSLLNGIQKAFPLDQLTEAGLGTFTGAQSLGRGASNWMKSMGKMVQGFDDLKPDIQNKVRDNIRQYAAPGGPLEQARRAMQDFEDFPWEEGAPTTSPFGTTTQASQTNVPNPTQNPSNPQLQTAQSTSPATAVFTHDPPNPAETLISSTTQTAKPTQGPSTIQHYIITKEGTSLETFNEFIQELDRGAGRSFTWEHVKQQSYATVLDDKSATELPKKHDFIWMVFPMTFDEEYDGSREEFRALRLTDPSPTTLPKVFHLVNATDRSLGSKPITRPHPRALLQEDHNAPWWKKMISTPPPEANAPLPNPANNPPYLADDSGGRGTTIYVLDDGFDVDLPVKYLIPPTP